MGGIKFLAPLALLLIFVLPTFANPITCLDSFSTLENFIDCHDKHIVPEEFYTECTYRAAQPTLSEIIEWTTVVNELLTNGCTPGSAVPVIGSDYVIRHVSEPAFLGASWLR